MNESIRNVIKDNEIVLWSGVPENFDIMDKTNKNGILTTIILAFTAAAVVSVIYANAVFSGMVPMQWAFIPLAFVIAACISYNKFAVSKKVAGDLTYFITNQRIITTDGRSSKLSSVYYPEIHKAKFVTDSDGHTSLLCGDAAVKYPAPRIRFKAAARADVSENHICDSYVMYAIPDADKVKEIIRDYLPIVK